MFQVEVEFNLEMPCEEIEKFRVLRDTVEYVARSFHAY
jgi:acyl carrier protein